MNKTIYKSQEKGVKWQISTYGLGLRNNKLFTYFYLLPTIEYIRDKTFLDPDDNVFYIKFAWLFWECDIFRYWGDAYKKHE